MSVKRKKREEELIKKNEESGRRENEEGKVMDRYKENSREECAGTQEPMTTEHNVPIRKAPDSGEEERCESSRMEEITSQNAMETESEINKNKFKELNK